MKLSELNSNEVELVTPSALRLSDLNPDEIEADTGPQVSQLESGLRGAAQGVSLGLADEGAGALDYLKKGFDQISKGGVLTNPNELGEAYAKGRDESRENFARAQQANPLTYGAGELAGSMALPVGSLNAAKGVALGGIQAFGSSDADNLGDIARDTGTGAVLGGAIGGVAPYISQGISKIGGMASDALEGAGNIAKSGADAFANKATNSLFGREALDAGAIKLGDAAKNIAGRLGDEASQGLRESVAARAAKEAAEGFFSDSDKIALATSIAGGPSTIGTVATGIVGKNLANTRGASTGAVALDQIGNLLKQTPQSFGKFAAPLQAAEARGALNPTVFILQQTNPEFRQLLYGKSEE